MATSLEVLNKAITRFEGNEARVQELVNGNETGYYQTNLTPQKQVETWPHFIDRLSDKATGVIAVAETAATRASASATAGESAEAALEAAGRAKGSEDAARSSEESAGQSADEAKEYADAAAESADRSLIKWNLLTDAYCDK